MHPFRGCSKKSPNDKRCISLLACFLGSLVGKPTRRFSNFTTLNRFLLFRRLFEHVLIAYQENLLSDVDRDFLYFIPGQLSEKTPILRKSRE